MLGPGNPDADGYRPRGVKIAVALVVLCAACASSPSTTTVGMFTVSGYVHAGPTCPVEHDYPDPNCVDRAVAEAQMVVLGAGGGEVARVSTDDSGRFTIQLPQGVYTFVPQPVAGLVGTAPPQDLIVPGSAALDVAYDTGIR